MDTISSVLLQIITLFYKSRRYHLKPNKNIYKAKHIQTSITLAYL